MTLRVGIDIGGTFTDVVAADIKSGQVFTAKTLTTPAAPAIGFRQGLADVLVKAERTIDQVDMLVHGTTLATNAIIERRGAKVAFVTTRGFRDILQIARERRYDIYNILYEVPRPLAPRHLCIEAVERVAADGTVLTPLDTSALVRAVGDLMSAETIEAVAICFLHAHINPENERKALVALETAFPDLFVCISSRLSSEPGEYERASTVTANAYVQPIVREYLGNIHRELKGDGFCGGFYVMLSDGGVNTAQFAASSPVHILESGPAGGVQSAVSILQKLDRPESLAFDMGGTTAKICLIERDRPSRSNTSEVARVDWSRPGSGLPIRAPGIELVEIGTGGGSIAHINQLGLIAVGPRSAGAVPGPACYGQGGSLPTVTDANLLLGYLHPDYFAGGRLKLDVGRAQAAVQEHIATPLGLPIAQAAWAVHNLANETMANAARLHAAQHGKDLSRHTMIASGGAGPTHAAQLARKLGINEVIFPRLAGVASALGFLQSPISRRVEWSQPALLEKIDWRRIDGQLEIMARQAADELAETGLKREDITFRYSCLMSYVGQGSELDVEVPAQRSNGATALLHTAFEVLYRRLYIRLMPSLEIHVSSWRVVAEGPLTDIPLATPATGRAAGDEPGPASRNAFDPLASGFRAYDVRDLWQLPADAAFDGPALVQTPDTTIVVPTGASARTDESGNLHVKLG